MERIELMRKIPTATELVARAKDGYFFELWLNSWVPVAEVSTPTAAMQYLKHKNPLNVCALAKQVIGKEMQNNRITNISYLTLFLISLLVATAISTTIVVPAIQGVDIDLYINRYPFLYAFAALIALLYIFGFIVLMARSHKAELEDACTALLIHAEKFKENLVYDYTLGKWISFQK